MNTDIKPVKVEFDSKGYSDLVSKIEDLEHRAVSQNKSLKHIETALRGSFRFHNDNVLDVRRPFELMMMSVRLKPDVIEFLEKAGTVVVEDGVKAFIVNNSVYAESNEKGVYILTYFEN